MRAGCDKPGSNMLHQALQGLECPDNDSLHEPSVQYRNHSLDSEPKAPLLTKSIYKKSVRAALKSNQGSENSDEDFQLI